MSRNYRSSSDFDWFTKLLILFWVVLAVWFLFRCVHSLSYATSEEISYTATVTKMEVKYYGRYSNAKYLVFTELADTGEIRVFQIADSLSHARWNSSDLYGSIEVDKTYIFNVYGYRTEILSEYENILSVEEVAYPKEE